MKSTFLYFGLILSLASLNGCENKDIDASLEIQKIEEEYAKVETAGSIEEISGYLQEAKENLEKYTSRSQSAKDVSGAGYDVGVIPSDNICPLYSEMVIVYLDNENNNPNSFQSGWTGNWEMTSQKNSYIKFCKVDGRLFSNVQGRFGLLKLGVNNPTGYNLVHTLRMDNQDSGTTTIYTTAADAAPNYVDGNRNFTGYFIEFENGDKSGLFPDLGFSYGVLGKASGNPLALASGTHYTDDEDNGCTTGESFAPSPPGAYYPIAFDIIRPSTGSGIQAKGTEFRLIKVRN